MNLDKNQLFPNQLTDGDFTECVGITVADVVGNMVGVPMDPDFSYAAGFNVANKEPSTAGEDPDWGTDGAIAFGCLPASLETFTALSAGEQFVMNFQNYSDEQKQKALQYAQNGKQNLYSFDDIWNWIQKGKSGVVLTIDWYQSFNIPNLQGFLPEPSGQHEPHCVGAYDTGEDVERWLLIKPWEGKDYGIGGYAKITEDIFNKVLFPTTSAYGFDSDATRWVSLLYIAVKRFPWFLSYLPSIINQKKT